MRNRSLAALAACFFILLSGSALAQMEKAANPMAIRLGAFWPADSAVRDATDDIWFSAGFDYTFRQTAEGNDWIGAFDFATTSGANIWSLQFIHMWRNTGASGSQRLFSFGLGGAVYFLDPEDGGSNTEFGIPLIAEWELSDTIFLQGKYHWVLSESDANGFQVSLGYRL